MIFRQKILSYKIYAVCLLVAFPTLIAISIIVGAIVTSNTDWFWLALTVALFGLFLLFAQLRTLQWFCVYSDHIEVRNPFGCVNKVYFSNVESVVIKKLPVFTKDDGVLHFVFEDGRPEKKRGITYISNSDNYKKIAVRVYVTDELKFIINNMERMGEFSIVEKF